MELSLHANATTTPRVRAYIQRSRKPVADLAIELGVSETTIRRWRERTTVNDRSHAPKTLTTSLSALEEALVCELRTRLQLPLDDITEVMRRCVNAKLSRSAIHRCLKRHGLSRRPQPDKPAVGVFEQATVGFIHVDLKHLPALQRRRSYAFVAIDRATRYVYLEIQPRRDADTAAGFLSRFIAHFPHRLHTILTDNGSEFTDRFAVDMKDKPRDRPSGRHPFDRVCAEHNIDHRLTKPYRPQTNGLVERFNRRIVEAIGRQPKRPTAHRLFVSHPERDAFLNRFVNDYNRTRLKCLGYLAPIQVLANPPGLNTCAGGISTVIGGYGRGAPLRIFSSEMAGQPEIYWFVPANSPIKTLADMNGKTIGYSATGSSSHAALLALLAQEKINATPTALGGVTASITAGMSGQVDAAWAAMPYGLKDLEEGKIRIIARAADIKVLQGRTVRVNMTSTDTLAAKKDQIERYMAGYKETIDYMYSSPEALAMYAEIGNLPLSIAEKMQILVPKESTNPDQIVGMDSVIAEAVATKFLSAPLTKEQVSELVQMKNPPRP